MAAKKPTDDPEFKSLEQRNSWHKRYAYVVKADLDATSSTNLATDSQYVDTAIPANTDIDVDSVFAIQMEADFKSAGNVQSVLGQTATVIGSSGTKPAWMIPGQLIRIPLDIVTTATNSTKIRDDYIVCAVQKVETLASDAEAIGALVKVVRPCVPGGSYRAAFKGMAYANSAWSLTAAAGESNKVYATGSAHAEGSTFPDTWKDQPYVDVYGLCQIFKTTCQMTNTARATQLKLVADEWGRVWKQ